MLKKYLQITIVSYLISLPLLLNLEAFSVSGVARYTDKIYNPDGFTGGKVLRPIRNAEIEVISALDGSQYGSGYTDENGNFSIGGAPAGVWLKIRIYARRLNGPRMSLTVLRASDGAVYTATTDVFMLGGDEEQNITVPLDSSGAFNIFDVIQLSFQYLYGATGIDGISLGLPTSPPSLRVFWEQGREENSRFVYEEGQNKIYLNGSLTDPDEFDDDMIMHEFGHYVAYNFARDDTPGGYHTIFGHYDLRLAWSEGWAHYYSASCRRWVHETFKTGEGRYPFYSYVVDNKISSSSSFELESPSPEVSGADNEVAVSAVLWDIIDSSNEDREKGTDVITSSYKKIMSIYLAMSADDKIPNATTLERFYDHAITLITSDEVKESGYSVEEAVQYILNLSDIHYELDYLETNDDKDTATDLTNMRVTKTNSITVKDLTLFPVVRKPDTNPIVEWDIFKVRFEAGKKYQIETYDLKDGADTVLYLYDPELKVEFARNDDAEPLIPEFKSSLIVWTCQATNNYYVVVAPYSELDAINVYGGYSLKISLYQEAEAQEPEVSESKGGGTRCFIATAAFDTPYQREVMLLRTFRKKCLLQTNFGKDINKAYYFLSPPLAQTIQNNTILKSFVRMGIDKITHFFFFSEKGDSKVYSK